MEPLNLTDTERAFQAKTTRELRYSYWIFRVMTHPWLVRIGTWAIKTALRLGLPVNSIIRATLFTQFCGGETLEASMATAEQLAQYKVGTILDFAVEGTQSETMFDSTLDEILRNIHVAKGNPTIPFTVFKMTGLVRFELLEKITAGAKLTAEESKEWDSAQRRVWQIGEEAKTNRVRVFVDAEESWIQGAIDTLVTELMRKLNHKDTLIYNTLQMYRTDRFRFLEESLKDAQEKKYLLGLKLVRGAYLEKERERAKDLGIKSPLHGTKTETDADYDRAVKFCLQHLETVSVAAGTHNEESTLRLVEHMAKQHIKSSDPRIHFAQLLGMSDHLSYNLAASGFNAGKYVPYGQVKVLIPYLIRRAQENTAIQGQTGRELWLISHELERRSLSPS